METTIMSSMGGCQNYGPLFGPLNTRRRIIIGIQNKTIILTTTHIGVISDYIMVIYWGYIGLGFSVWGCGV